MLCSYCWAPMPTRLTKYGRVHSVQPVACCEAHTKRLAEWDKWIMTSRTAAMYGHRQPSLPLGKTWQAAIQTAKV